MVIKPPEGKPVTPKPFVQSISARTAVVVELGDQIKSVAAVKAVVFVDEAIGLVPAAAGEVPVGKAESPASVVVIDAPDVAPVTVPRTSK